MKSQHLDLLNEAATVLATHGWEKTKKEDHGDSAVFRTYCIISKHP